ncbi:MAG: ComF family protein [bacterium]|nr:ComF family protein [bacterium]
MLEEILDFLYPRCCPVCDEIVLPKGDKICPDCLKKLHFVHSPTCKCCGKEVLSQRQEYCLDCQRHPKSFREAFALINYEETARHSMAAIKYKNKAEYLDCYAKLICAKHRETFKRLSPAILIPVPIHPKRYRERGFNQAELLARKIAAQTGMPVRSDILIRTKNTKPLKEMTPSQRKTTLKAAFCCTKKCNEQVRVILVDDIYTTGATAEACTQSLKLAGATEVYVLTICVGSHN